MRRLLVLVLCLLMPLQGMAASQAIEPPCPMQDMMAMAYDASDMEGGCCNDLATFEITGQACKSGQACGAPAVWLSPLSLMAFPPQPDPMCHPPAWRSPPQDAPERLWRPPTSV